MVITSKQILINYSKALKTLLRSNFVFTIVYLFLNLVFKDTIYNYVVIYFMSKKLIEFPRFQKSGSSVKPL